MLAVSCILLLAPGAIAEQLIPNIQAPSSVPRLVRPLASSGTLTRSTSVGGAATTDDEYKPAFLSPAAQAQQNRPPPMSSYPNSAISPEKYYSTGFAPAPGLATTDTGFSGPVVEPRVVPAYPSESPMAQLQQQTAQAATSAPIAYLTGTQQPVPPASFSSYAAAVQEEEEEEDDHEPEFGQFALPADFGSRLAAVVSSAASTINGASLPIQPNPIVNPASIHVINPVDPPAPVPAPAPATVESGTYAPQPSAELPQQPLSSLHVTTEEPEDLAYELNYCDKGEFPDDVLTSYGLARLDYFVYNTSCSRTFFQCSIGKTYVLKCSSDAEAFDRFTHNCNFRHDIRYCPEYDHITHCTIRETCGDSDYACCSLPQACLPLSKRCDGHADCADGDDENNCPSCARDEFACVKSGACIKAEKRCDGVVDDCGDGSNLDEIGCSRNSTCIGKYNCHMSHTGPSCVEWDVHCDGKPDCAGGEDEMNCRQNEAKYLLCENQKQSVTKQQWCDGTAHCADGSDEKYCY